MALFQAVKASLDASDWNYSIAREGSLIKAGAKGENGSFAVVFDVKEERQIMVIYIISNINFPEHVRPRLAIYLTHCNYGMTLGNFEMDMDDGEVRYKCSVNTTGSILSEEMVDEMLKVSLVVMDRFFGPMIKVAYANYDPKAAYDEASVGIRSSGSSPSRSSNVHRGGESEEEKRSENVESIENVLKQLVS